VDARSLGLAIVAVGIAVAVVGVGVATGAFGWFGRLPGDIRIGGEHTSVFVPITSMLVVSVAISVLVNLLRRFL
jgi:Protein of unknown function (DUF2905)